MDAALRMACDAAVKDVLMDCGWVFPRLAVMLPLRTLCQEGRQVPFEDTVTHLYCLEQSELPKRGFPAELTPGGSAARGERYEWGACGGIGTLWEGGGEEDARELQEHEDLRAELHAAGEVLPEPDFAGWRAQTRAVRAAGRLAVQRLDDLADKLPRIAADVAARNAPGAPVAFNVLFSCIAAASAAADDIGHIVAALFSGEQLADERLRRWASPRLQADLALAADTLRGPAAADAASAYQTPLTEAVFAFHDNFVQHLLAWETFCDAQLVALAFGEEAKQEVFSAFAKKTLDRLEGERAGRVTVHPVQLLGWLEDAVESDLADCAVKWTEQHRKARLRAPAEEHAEFFRAFAELLGRKLGACYSSGGEEEEEEEGPEARGMLSAVCTGRITAQITALVRGEGARLCAAESGGAPPPPPPPAAAAPGPLPPLRTLPSAAAAHPPAGGGRLPRPRDTPPSTPTGAGPSKRQRG